MFTGPVGPVEVFFYWPEAVFGNFYWPGAIGSPLASSPGPYSKIDSFRNSNGFSCFLKFCTLSAALMLSGSSFQRRGAYPGTECSVTKPFQIGEWYL